MVYFGVLEKGKRTVCALRLKPDKEMGGFTEQLWQCLWCFFSL
jgi:hypothetical protein